MSDAHDDPTDQQTNESDSSNRRKIIDLAVEFLTALPQLSTLDTADRPSSPDALTIRKTAELLSQADGRSRSTAVPLFEFPERASLMAAVAAEGFRRLIDSLRSVPGATAAARLEQLCLGYVEWAMRHPMLFRTMYDPLLAPGVALVHTEHHVERRKAGLAELYRSRRGIDDDARSDTGDTALKRRRIVHSRQDRKRLTSFDELLQGKEQALALFEWAAGEAVADGTMGGLQAPLVAHTSTALADGLAWQLLNEPQGTPEALMTHARDVIGLTMNALTGSLPPHDSVAERASARASWPVRISRVSEQPVEDLCGTTTVAERLAMLRELTASTWELTGNPEPAYRRTEMPVRTRRP